MRSRRLAEREATALVVLVLATAIVARPWAWRTDLVFAQGDTAFTLVALEHLQDVLLHGAPWKAVGLSWPLPDAVVETDWVGAPALLALPLRVAGVDALLQHTALVLLGLLATAWACHRLARALVGPGPWTWVAGAVGGFGPFAVGHAQHVNLVHHEATVLGALALGSGLRHRRAGLAAAGGAVLALSGHFGLYVGLQSAVVGMIVGLAALSERAPAAASGTLAATSATAGPHGRRQPPWRALAAALVGFALAGLTLLPVVLAWRHAAVAWGAWTDPAELRGESWDLAATLMPVGGGSPGGHVVLDPPNPGYVTVVLVAVGLSDVLRSRRGDVRWRAVVAVLVVSLLLALGPEVVWNGHGTGLPGPYALLMRLPGAAGLRAPARWFAVAALASAPLAALGVRRLASWASSFASPGATSAGMVVAVLAMALVLAEVTSAHAQSRAEVALDPAYAALDDVREAGALYDEVVVAEPTCACRPRDAVRAALLTGRPLVGGAHARKLDVLDDVDGLARTWPSADAEAFFRATGVRVTLEHPPLTGDPPADADCRLLPGDHRLCVLPDGPGPSTPRSDALLRRLGLDGPPFPLPPVRGLVAGDVRTGDAVHRPARKR